MFFMASYDIDRFRRFVMSDEEYALLEKDDVALTQFGFKLMKQVFFGEMTIKERKGPWEKRVEEQREILELRKQVEITEIILFEIQFTLCALRLSAVNEPITTI